MRLVCIYVFFCVYLTSFATCENLEDNRQFRHDYVYYPNAKGWFKFHKIPATWENARTKCFHEGAVLASPINKQVHAAMQDILKNERHMAYTGIQSLTSTGDYYSIEGVDLIQMPVVWRKDEPNNIDDNERCLAMKWIGTIADVRCSKPRRFICYKNKTMDLPMNSCGTSDKAYLEVNPGQCYKYHAECVDWPRAHMVCSSEGGHLAIINSNAEANLLHELFFDKSTNTSKCSSQFLHFGYRNPLGSLNQRLPDIWPSKQTTGAPYWLTVEGQTLEDAGFSTWAPNQPDNNGGQEYCGAASFRNTTAGADESPVALKDIPCTLNLAFICEINGAKIPYVDKEHVL